MTLSLLVFIYLGVLVEEKEGVCKDEVGGGPVLPVALPPLLQSRLEDTALLHYHDTHLDNVHDAILSFSFSFPFFLFFPPAPSFI